MPRTLNENEVIHALEVLGKRIGGYDEIEILIVGGMAGKFSGLLPPDRVTVDCDVMVYDPESSFGNVEQHAFEVAKALGLPKEWLNGVCQAFAYKLPAGWRDRRRHLGDFGMLRVFYVDRFDLIALKVLSGRAVDQQDLIDLKVTKQEIVAVRRHVDQLKASGVGKSEIIADAEIILDELEKMP